MSIQSLNYATPMRASGLVVPYHGFNALALHLQSASCNGTLALFVSGALNNSVERPFLLSTVWVNQRRYSPPHQYHRRRR